MMSDIVYLDYAAATPLHPAAFRAMEPYFSDNFYNPSSPYAPAVEVRRAYEHAKEAIASVLGARSADLIMTAGATESINLALTAAQDGHIVTTAIEHHAVLHATRNYDLTIVGVPRKGVVDPQAIAEAIQPSTRVVSVALANNEIGTIQPLREIADVVATERKRRQQSGENNGIWLHADASQGVGQIDINLARLGVDMLTLNAAKCYGPKQVGLLWKRPEVPVKPLVFGGGQEMNLRSGTENVAGVIGFSVALEKVTQKRKSESKRLAELRDKLESALAGADVGIDVTIAHKKRLPGSLHIYAEGIDAERVIFMLESKGVLVATGSACAANSGTRSHVLDAIGLTPSQADGSLRITLGRNTTSEHIHHAASAIIESIKSERARIGA